MITSSLDRTTLKLLVAAFFALGGASMITAHAQDIAAGPTGVFGDPIGSPVAYGNGGETEGLAAHPTCVVYDNGRRALIQGAALHDGQFGNGAAVALEVINSDGSRTLHAFTASGDGSFIYDLPVAPNVFAVRVSIAEQPDAMSPCTRPNVEAAPGLGLGGVAISNSSPSADATSNVDAAVDAYNLF